MFKLRKKIISREDGTPYLIRTYLFKSKSFQIVIHKVLQSDPDCLHDHPWNFISLILKGGYWEGTTPEQRLNNSELEWFNISHGKGSIYYRWYGPLSLLFRKAEWKHRLRLRIKNDLPYVNGADINGVIQKPCTTLVIMFKRKREWGFFTKAGWVPWQKYNNKEQRCD